MGMSSSVTGLRAKDAQWGKKREAVKALVAAGEAVPDSLMDFFGGMEPENILKDDTAGLEVEIPEKEGSDEASSWIEINVKDIPAGVERIRFINSW